MRRKHVLTFLLMTACSDYQVNPIEDPGLGPVVVDTGSPGQGDVPDEDDPLEVEERLTCQTGDRVVLSEVIRFPARENCLWSVEGNLGPRDGHNQARFTETELLDLPAYSDLCSLSIVSQTSDLVFDDHFTLTLGDWVLVGGGGYPIESLEAQSGMFLFDWEAVKGQPIIWDGQYHCLGGPESVCVIPGHDQRAPLELAFTEEAMQPLAETLDGESGLAISLHTFGDNDDGDCAHSDIQLLIEVEMIQR
ncbi:MAG: hypothetical protein AAFV53_04565 [Myxococcota bacterium]